MNVAACPWPYAVILATYLTSIPMSPASTIPASGISSSTCPGPPTSWWWYFTGTPIAPSRSDISARKL